MRYLKAGYSPEQIAGTLAAVHPDLPSLRVSHETIYTAIYAMPRGELRTEVIGWLRFGHAKRRPRARGEDRRKIPDMVSTHDRPPEIEERLVPGHWEGDLIKGAYNPVPRWARWWSAPRCSRCWPGWTMPAPNRQ